MAENMEAMLLGGSDSDDSSDDGDTETLQEVKTGTAVPAAAAVAATIQQAQKPQAPAPGTQAATQANLSQSELSSRLKSLYSPANKAPQQSAPAPAPVPPASRPVPTQQLQAQPKQPQQARVMNVGVQQQPPQATTQRRNAMKPQQPQQAQRQSSGEFRPLVPNARSTDPAQQQTTPKRPSASSTADPFEPTPLKTMIQRQQQKAAAAQAAAATKQQQATLRSPPNVIPQTKLRTNTSTSSTTSQSSSASTTVHSNTTSDRARQERDAKHRKERFLMFTRVLMKYLEQKDPAMHVKAKAVIRECAEKNKKKEPGYESVTSSMQTRLRAMVGDSYWTRAEAYLTHFLKQKEKLDEQKKKGGSSSQSKSSSSSSQSRSSSSKQKTPEQLAAERQQIASVTQQKLQEIQREKEKIKQQAEMQKRKNEEERRRAEALKKEQIRKEAMAKAAARSVAEAQAQTHVKKKKEHKRKGSGSSAAGIAAARGMSPMPQPTERAEKHAPREYSELMVSVDHAVDYDWTSAALLLGKDARAEVSLNNEQKRLLYGKRMVPPRPGTEAAQSALPSSELPASMRGWGKRNVLSSRGAWARVRLREQREQLARAGKKQAPVVGGLRLPSARETTSDDMSVVKPEARWFNEEKAEGDKTLALVSEATEMYLKSILQKALTAARQRENLDGVRLWHLQHGPSKPPMSLRLGCDVNRQVAQAEGNAAKTVKRMEEALERQTRVPAKARALDNDETLYNATSMSDLALRPKLANAAEEADESAKRSFEVYGGKETTEAPPFGRVPKRPKITTKDFSLAREWTDYSHQRKGIATPHIM